MRLIVREVIQDAGLPGGLEDLLFLQLRQPGKVFGEGRARWPELVFAAAGSAGGDASAAVIVAAAVELLVAGLDVLDEAEDEDASPLIGVAGVPPALNAATAFLFLAHATLSDERLGTPWLREQLHAAAARAGVQATAGQHLDLSLAGASLGEVLEVARTKAGSLAAGACEMGAVLGCDDRATLDLYAQWGLHFGTMNQLANDLHDALSPEIKSDVRRGKRTLPLEYARLALGSDADTADPEAIIEALKTNGAVEFTWVVFEAERQRCVEILNILETRGQASEALMTLIG